MEDEASGNNDNVGREGDKADSDYLEEMLWANGLEVILKNVKSVENLERVKKAAKQSSYGVKKGSLTH